MANVDRDRCIARTLGNCEMYMWRAMRRLGAWLESGSSTPSGGFSGSSSNACRIFAMSDCKSACASESVARESWWSLLLSACSSRQRSHLKSSMYSTLSIPSRQALREVEEACGTLSVRVTKVDTEGFGLKWHVWHSICDSILPSNGKPSSSAGASLSSSSSSARLLPEPSGGAAPN